MGSSTRINPDFLNIGRGEKIKVHEIGKIYKHIKYDVCLESKFIGSAFGNLIQKCLRRGNRYSVYQTKILGDRKLATFGQSKCLPNFSNCKSDVSKIEFSIRLKQ